ncbi:MAG TPA: hypothetical protein VHB25_18040, partial [Gemmatimonadaceae bacterium]|nr:hypothetical protein [Gemmatimonadaceae bacterium]
MDRRFAFLTLAALVAACSTEPTSPPSRLSPSDRAPSPDVTVSSRVVIDNFMTGGGTWQSCGALFNYVQDPSIIGGARETYSREAGPCSSAGAKTVIDASQGTMAWGGNNTYSSEYGVAYGTEIGYVQPYWLGDPNRGKGTPLHLALTLGDKIQISMAQVSSENPSVTITLRDASGNAHQYSFQAVAGANSVPVSAFGMSAAAANDIAGFSMKTYGVKTSRDVFLGMSVQPSDNTPPVITPTITGPLGQNGWYTGNVTVAWDVKDPDSPIISSSGCDTVRVISDTDGQPITCTATSAGGTNAQTVTIMRDATLPTVTYAGNAGSYTVDQTVAITCTANDATNPGSGLASSTCADISGAAYTFAVGSNAFSATATDKAGNVGSGSTSFNVSVT